MSHFSHIMHLQFLTITPQRSSKDNFSLFQSSACRNFPSGDKRKFNSLVPLLVFIAKNVGEFSGGRSELIRLGDPISDGGISSRRLMVSGKDKLQAIFSHGH